MALPRQFRRYRIALIGFGDVAKRTLEQQQRHHLEAHGPRLILVGRSGCTALSVEQVAAIKKSRFCIARLDIDRRQDAQRIIRVGQAAIIYAPTAETGTKGQDPRMRQLANSVRRSGKRLPLVYLSTTGVYGDHAGGIVTELSHCHPTQARSRRRLDAERVLRPLGAHVLRVPGIYAHDRLPTARLASRQPALRQEDDVYTNHIHADDLARIAWRALFRGRPTRVTNAVDNTELKMADYFDAVADATGLPRPPRISADQMRQLGAAGAVNPMMMSFLSESRRVYSNRLAKELGVRLQYPTIAHTLNEIRTPKGAR
jgi:nucleoside-diphosphate-sugar epimerase